MSSAFARLRIVAPHREKAASTATPSSPSSVASQAPATREAAPVIHEDASASLSEQDDHDIVNDNTLMNASLSGQMNMGATPAADDEEEGESSLLIVAAPVPARTASTTTPPPDSMSTADLVQYIESLQIAVQVINDKIDSALDRLDIIEEYLRTET